MERSGTTIVFVIVSVAVLLGAWGIGLCIRQVRFRSAGIESKAVAEVEKADIELEKEPAEMVQVRPEKGPMPAGEDEGPFDNPSEEEARPREAREETRERFENTSEEERQELRAQMRERPAGRRQEGGYSFRNLSEEERARFREEVQRVRERWEYMSEEEKEEFRTQRHERLGGQQPQGGEDGRR